MLAVQRWESPRRVFAYLYIVSDQQGLFELDASQISAHTGLSRKTVYKAIAFLQRVHLLFLHEARTGRGRHSVYRLNWRKPAPKHQQAGQKMRPAEVDETAAHKKCHPPIRYKRSMKLKNIHPSGDGPQAIPGDIISPANRPQWNRCMKAFRETLDGSQLPTRYRRVCTALVGRHLKGKTRAYALKLFEKLRGLVRKLRVPEWVQSVGDLCRWFMGWLKNLFTPKPKPKRRRFRDYNEYLWHLHEREVERVRRKRAEYESRELSVAERWREWAEKQRAELVWSLKQAERARQLLQAAVRS